MTDIIVCGCCGKMGAAITGLIATRPDARVVAGVDAAVCTNATYPVYTTLDAVVEKADVIIDFSHPSLLSDILGYCEKKEGLAAVLCTTGYSEGQTAEILRAANTLPLFYSRNMSLGINLLISLAQKAQAVLGDAFDIEIIEKHHNQKIDAPSGTALMIADALNEPEYSAMRYVYDRHSSRTKRTKQEIGLHAVRGGTIVGEHEVLFAGNHETLSLSHSAQSKELFASGAVNAAVFMKGQAPGLYDMSNLI